MKITKRYLFPLVALLALTGCKEDETTVDPGREGFRILASIDAPAGMNSWQAQDQIKVVCNDELYTFASAEGGATAEFTDRAQQLSAQVIGNKAISAFSNCTSMWGTYRIQAEQLAHDGVNTARVPMFAYTLNSPEQDRLRMTFNPLASLLELTIKPYDMTVRRLTIAPAEDATISGGAMAGGFTVNAAQSTVAINNPINSIAVDFAGGFHLAQGATLRIPIGWFAVEGGLTLTFEYGNKTYTNTIWAEEGIVKTFSDNAGYKSARLIKHEFEFDANYFPRAFYVKTDASATSKGLTWEAPTTLDYALRHAAAGSTIHIAAGSYAPQNALTGGGESDEFRSFEIARNLTLIGGYPTQATEGAQANPASNKTILDGQGTSFHTLVVSAPKLTSEKVVVQGLTIQGGKNSTANKETLSFNGANLGNNYAAGVAVVGTTVELVGCTITANGGEHATGLYAIASSLKITDCAITNNAATANGGGMWISSGCELTMSGTTIDNNTAGMAAGLYLYAASGESIDATISETTISSNTASGNTGALYVRDDSGNQSLRNSFTNCVISGNSGTMGGAIQLLNAKTTFNGCRILNNTASGNGVIYATTTGAGNSNTLFQSCTISGNQTTGTAVASGIYAYNNGGKLDLQLVGSTCSANKTGGRGGAIYARNNVTGGVTLTCVNSTFSGNESGSFGGAIAMFGAANKGVTTNLISCTLTDNASTHATNAGGAVGMETVALTLNTHNSILSGNRAGANANDVFVKAGITATIAHKNSIIGDKFYTTAGAEQATTPTFTASTMLAALADNGGATRTCKLVGSASTNPAFGNGMTATDLKKLASAEITDAMLGADQTGAERGDADKLIGACVKK